MVAHRLLQQDVKEVKVVKDSEWLGLQHDGQHCRMITLHGQLAAGYNESEDMPGERGCRRLP